MVGAGGFRSGGSEVGDKGGGGGNGGGSDSGGRGGGAEEWRIRGDEEQRNGEAEMDNETGD